MAFTGIPVIDLKDPESKTQIAKACEEFGFFKLVNHGVPCELIASLESHAFCFFNLPQSDKDQAGPLDPFGYSNKIIGTNGDVGWIEYLHLNAHQVTSPKTLSIFNHDPVFRCAIEEYIKRVKTMSCEVVELMAEAMGIEPRNLLSKMVSDEKSDAWFRISHYPPISTREDYDQENCSEQLALHGGISRSLIGFGEHTDPQIITVIRSNHVFGLQICLRDGTWVSVPPDQSAFFINVGDSLQVMTNGRFKSVKHRVMANSKESRISMIYFHGPPFHQKIAPLTSIIKEGEESLYKEFTWTEYKTYLSKTRLSDHRLAPFENALS